MNPRPLFNQASVKNLNLSRDNASFNVHVNYTEKKSEIFFLCLWTCWNIILLGILFPLLPLPHGLHLTPIKSFNARSEFL